MRPYSEAVKADVRRRMSPPHRQSVTEIAQELGTHLRGGSAPIPRPAPAGGSMGLPPQGVEGKGGASGGQTMPGGGSKADRKKAVS
jgi:hypothetical protein